IPATLRLGLDHDLLPRRRVPEAQVDDQAVSVGRHASEKLVLLDLARWQGWQSQANVSRFHAAAKLVPIGVVAIGNREYRFDRLRFQRPGAEAKRLFGGQGTGLCERWKRECQPAYDARAPQRHLTRPLFPQRSSPDIRADHR